MNRIIYIFASILLLNSSCNSNQNKENAKAPAEVPQEYKDNPTKVEWENPVHDFGTIPKDTIVEYIYKFKNIGDNPLIVADCKATCGCTVPDCKQPPVPPGGEGQIVVKFNSANKANKINKTVKVYMNTEKEFEQVKFSVFVDDGFQDVLKD